MLIERAEDTMKFAQILNAFSFFFFQTIVNIKSTGLRVAPGPHVTVGAFSSPLS